VRAIAEGRVWSGEQARRLGLVDSLGSLEAALKSAASLAKITGDYDVQEFPRQKNATERLTELLEDKPAPAAARAEAAVALVTGRGAAGTLARDITRELQVLLSYEDPRGVYARLPYLLRIH
jgi:protease-4